MHFKIFHNAEGAKNAYGLVVVIDVFRAFTTECYVMANGAEKIIPAGDLSLAYKLKTENPDFILMGEQNGEIPSGFDYGNSPFLISEVDFSGKTVIHISTAGTKGMSNAQNASEIITGSFVNAAAIAKYIKEKNVEIVSFVCTGTDNVTIRDEDALCAEYIQNLIEGKYNDFDGIMKHVKSGGYIDRFIDPTITKYPIEDIDYCFALDKFDFVIKASSYGEDLIQLRVISNLA
jgi:2-phosphosulfolactate phosphatase